MPTRRGEQARIGLNLLKSAKVCPQVSDYPGIKIILSVAEYLFLTFALGMIMAMTAPREDSGPEQAEGL